ncbi:MAG: DNA-directed RNA polymerase subunit alpha [Chloroflexi bacterium]|nr:DNA-directed RNA polymerase subunit alpha [Chloroflexota bacterium]
MPELVIPKVECVECKDNFGRFTADPLEKGFGVTLGNALRRVLLSYLPGAAITRVRIEGIQHELSIIPNVKEDVTEFLLNVKAIRLKSLTGQPGKLLLDKQGPGMVTAGDIQASADFEIVNPDIYLATLDAPEARLYVEFDVELGEGFREAEATNNQPIGVIPVDALFTPMRKVNFTVEPVRFGREASHERLNLEVWTDGTMSPSNAVSRSASILIEQLMPLANYAMGTQVEGKREAVRITIPDEKFNKPIEELNLSVRTLNCLRRSGITTVGELITRGEKELMTLRNFGKKSRQEVEERLAELGVSLAPFAGETPGTPEASEVEEEVPGEAQDNNE